MKQFGPYHIQIFIQIFNSMPPMGINRSLDPLPKAMIYFICRLTPLTGKPNNSETRIPVA